MTNIGHAVWLRRPDTRSNYFAYGNVTPKFRQWVTHWQKNCHSGNNWQLHQYSQKPEGLTVEAGTIGR